MLDLMALLQALVDQSGFRKQLGAFVEPLRAASKHAAPQVSAAATDALRLMRDLYRDDWLKLM